MKKFRLWWKQFWCNHCFDYDDLVGCISPDDDVIWPCWKCGKVFKHTCGLDVLRYGRAQQKPKD